MRLVPVMCLDPYSPGGTTCTLCRLEAHTSPLERDLTAQASNSQTKVCQVRIRQAWLEEHLPIYLGATHQCVRFDVHRFAGPRLTVSITSLICSASVQQHQKREKLRFRPSLIVSCATSSGGRRAKIGCHSTLPGPKTKEQTHCYSPCDSTNSWVVNVVHQPVRKGDRQGAHAS